MNDARQLRDDGFTLTVVLTMMLPLLIAVAAFMTLMIGRSDELRTELDQELALLAAESGVDDAMFKGRTGALVDGNPYTRTLGNGHSYSVVPTHLKVDGADNDGDGNTDEADEDVFQIVVTGTYRRATRRIAAYLGPVPLLPSITSAVASQDPNISIVLQGTSKIDGHDVNIDGTPGPGPDMPGFTIGAPGTIAHLLSELSPSERNKIQGTGPTPSLGIAPSFDLATIVAQIKNIASLVLTSDKYSSYNFGNGSTGTAFIMYREGDVRFAGNCRGAGILLVTGDLEVKGNFRFDGVLIVLGKIQNSAGTADIYGSVVQGPSGGIVTLKGTAEFHYSAQAIALANSLSGKYVSLNGWQEISSK